jgi:ABC-type multidrug transport system fused ATPase/permease subunit
MGENGLRLSGGQVQRLSIARALYNKPDLLILDEATSSLDTITEKVIQDAIHNLHGLVTTITIAHRLSTIKDCDEIFVLENGLLLGSGSYNDLEKNNELFKKLIKR